MRLPLFGTVAIESRSAELGIVEMLPISDYMLNGEEATPVEVESTTEDYDEEKADNTWLFVGIGVGIIVLIGIVVFMMKKQ